MLIISKGFRAAGFPLDRSLIPGCILPHKLVGLGQVLCQIHTVGIGHLSIGSLRHSIRLPKGNAPLEKQPQLGPHGMGAGFHNNEAALGDGFQLVRSEQGTLHHLEGLTGVVLATAHGAGQDGAAAQGFGQHLGGLAVGGKATENGVLS